MIMLSPNKVKNVVNVFFSMPVCFYFKIYGSSINDSKYFVCLILIVVCYECIKFKSGNNWL